MGRVTAIREMIDRRAETVGAALDVAQRGAPDPITLEGVAAVAEMRGEDAAEMLLSLLPSRRALNAFTRALVARDALPERASGARRARIQGLQIPHQVQDIIVPRARRLSCLIRVDGNPAGSGFLVGPSLVMTAWHVIGLEPTAVKSATGTKAPVSIHVRLSNGRTVRAFMPPVFHSPCSPQECKNRFPKRDRAYAGFHDVALLRLATPEGARLGVRSLRAATLAGGNPIVLFHFPSGRNKGVGFGQLQKVQNLNARWSHNVPTQAGSSGGACFDFEEGFVGIHNARVPGSRRLVPADRFIAAISPYVASDIAPVFLWRLDDEIVIGRDQFFEAVSLASVPGARVRGVRVKRLEGEKQGTKGLAFSYAMLERILERNPGAHRLVALTFDAISADPLGDIARRAVPAGQGAPDIEARPGLRPGEASVQATMKSRAQDLARAVSQAAREARGAGGQTWWFYVEDPGRRLAPEELAAIEQFAAAAIGYDNLRVVLAGFELVQTPGPELSGVGAGEDGEPGFLVEIFGGIERRDVEHVLTLAAAEFGRPLTPAELEMRTTDVLRMSGAAGINGRYGLDAIEAIRAAIKADLRRLQP